MSNLIPLHLDKDTGKYVAKFKPHGPLPPNTFITYGYTHVQLIPSLIWTITHNNNTDDLIAQIYDSTNQLVMPNSVIVNDSNTVTITFNEVLAGKAQLVLFINA